MNIRNGEKVLMAAVGGLALYLIIKNKFGSVVDAVNPASRENVVFQTLAGEDDTIRLFDTTFARATLLNPFASEESKRLARQFLTLNDPDTIDL